MEFVSIACMQLRPTVHPASYLISRCVSLFCTTPPLHTFLRSPAPAAAVPVFYDPTSSRRQLVNAIWQQQNHPQDLSRTSQPSTEVSCVSWKCFIPTLEWPIYTNVLYLVWNKFVLVYWLLSLYERSNRWIFNNGINIVEAREILMGILLLSFFYLVVLFCFLFCFFFFLPQFLFFVFQDVKPL